MMLINFLSELESFEQDWAKREGEFLYFLDSIEMPSLEYCAYDFHEYIEKIIEYSKGNKHIAIPVLKRIIDTESDLYKVICYLLSEGYINVNNY